MRAAAALLPALAPVLAACADPPLPAGTWRCDDGTAVLFEPLSHRDARLTLSTGERLLLPRRDDAPSGTGYAHGAYGWHVRGGGAVLDRGGATALCVPAPRA